MAARRQGQPYGSTGGSGSPYGPTGGSGSPYGPTGGSGSSYGPTGGRGSSYGPTGGSGSSYGPTGGSGSPYGTPGSAGTFGGGGSNSNPGGFNAGNRTQMTGGGGHEEFNTRLFIACAIGGAIGTIVAMLLAASLYTKIPNVPLYGIMMAVIALGVLVGAVTATTSYGEDYPKTIAVALGGALLMFAAAALFEYIYEIKLVPKAEEETVEEVPATVPTDYIFCIDDSGSMEGDPGAIDYERKRDSALIALIDKLDSSSRVGILRYTDVLKTDECVEIAPLDDEQRERLLGVLNNHTAGGMTDFAPPLQEALNEYGRQNEAGRKPVVVLLTDGNCQYDKEGFIKDYNEQGIIICGIYLGNDQQDLDELTYLCEQTGGFVLNADDADQLLGTYTTIVEQTSGNTTAEDPDYIRFLAGPREGTDKLNALSIIERLLFFALLGLLLGATLRVMLGEKLFKQIFIGAGCGLLAGAIVEFGYLIGLGPVSRVGYLLYIIVIANYGVADRYVGKYIDSGTGNGPYISSDSIGSGGNIGQDKGQHRGGRIN